MAGLVNAGDISSYVQTIFEDAQLKARENSILPALVRGWNDRMGTAIRSRSDYGTVTFMQIADTDDLTSQAFTPSVDQSLTPYEYGAQFLITDLRVESDPFGVRADAAAELGAGAAQHVQTAIASTFASLSAGTVGSAGGTLTWGNFFAAQAYLRAQFAPMPWACVLRPEQWYYLGTVPSIAGAQTNGPAIQDEFARNFWVSNVAGVDIYVCADLTAGTACKAAMFSQDAIGYDIRRAFGVEPERDASRRGWELNASMVYATGVWRPKWGVQMIGTSTIA
jgi:hypothetical protein